MCSHQKRATTCIVLAPSQLSLLQLMPKVGGCTGRLDVVTHGTSQACGQSQSGTLWHLPSPTNVKGIRRSLSKLNGLQPSDQPASQTTKMQEGTCAFCVKKCSQHSSSLHAATLYGPQQRRDRLRTNLEAAIWHRHKERPLMKLMFHHDHVHKRSPESCCQSAGLPRPPQKEGRVAPGKNIHISDNPSQTNTEKQHTETLKVDCLREAVTLRTHMARWFRGAVLRAWRRKHTICTPLKCPINKSLRDVDCIGLAVHGC